MHDFSRFNLSNTTTVIITVIPDPLDFNQTEYVVNIEEEMEIGSEVAHLPIRTLSASSNIIFTIAAVEPPPAAGLQIFSTSNSTEHVLVVSLANRLDMEARDYYILNVTATRPGERAQAHLVINVYDKNDNFPQLISGLIYNVEERMLPGSHVVITLVGADPDLGMNGTIHYNIISTGTPSLSLERSA